MPGYQDSVMQLRFCREHWEALEEVSRIRRGRDKEFSENGLVITNFRAYFRAAIHKMAEEAACLQAMEASQPKTYNQFPIPDADKRQLEMLAVRFNISVPKLLSMLIVHPMLREYYATNGFCASRSASDVISVIRP